MFLPIERLIAGLAAVLLLCLAAVPAQALSGEDSQTINRISGYLNSFQTLQGEFTQVAPNGHVSTGVFVIAKPGRMRFEYASPNPFIIVSDGRWVTVKNRSRNKADQYPLSATPLSLVLADRVDLLGEANIRGVERSDGIATVTIEDRNKFVDGRLVLVFDEQNNQLQQWIVVDGQGRRTTVSISNLSNGVKADPALFAVKIPPRKKRGSDR